jgi:GR25 family glycosyltransferase involved in LPS biosynthesis
MIEKAEIFARKFKYNFPNFLINLERRKDRLEKFNTNNGKYFDKIYKIHAIDGKTLDINKFMNVFKYPEKIIKKNPYGLHNYNKSVLGCALSHINIWEKILTSELTYDDDFVLVLEDDIYIKKEDDYYKRMNEIYNKLKYDLDWDIVFLGFTDYKKIQGDIEYNKLFIKLSGERRLNGGGTFGYFIRKKACKKLFSIISRFKICQAIDWFLIEQFDKLTCYKLKKDLIYSDIEAISKDSDIQNQKVVKPVVNPVKEQVFKPINKPVVKPVKEEVVKPINKPVNNREIDNRFSNEDLIVYKKNQNKVSNLKLKIDKKHLNQFIDENNNIRFYFKDNQIHKSVENNKDEKYTIQIMKNISYKIIYCGENTLTLDLILKYSKSINENIIILCNTFFNDIIIENINFIYYEKFKLLYKQINYNELIIVDPSILNSIKIDNRVKLYYNKYNMKTNNYFIKNLLNNNTNIIFENLECKKDLELKFDIELNRSNYTINKKEYNFDVNNYENKNNNIVIYNKNIDMELLNNIKNNLSLNDFKFIIFSDNKELSKQDNLIIYDESEYYNIEHIYNNKLLLFTEKSDDFYWLLNKSIELKTILIVSDIYPEYNNKYLTINKKENIIKALNENNYRNIIFKVLELTQ